MNIKKHRKASVWRTITVIDDCNNVVQSFNLCSMGKLMYKFSKAKPRNLFEEITKYGVEPPHSTKPELRRVFLNEGFLKVKQQLQDKEKHHHETNIEFPQPIPEGDEPTKRFNAIALDLYPLDLISNDSWMINKVIHSSV